MNSDTVSNMRPEVIRPRLNILSTIALVSVGLLQVLFGVWVYRDLSGNMSQAFWIALMWFGCTATGSVCCTSPISVRRVLPGIALFAWHVLWMATCWQESVLRYIGIFGTLLLIQSIASASLGIPAWAVGRDPRILRSTPVSFTIRTVLLLTTSIAVLVRVYQLYGVSTIVVPLAAVPVMVLLHLGCVSMMLSQEQRLLRALMLIIVLMFGSTLISWLASSVNTQSYLTLRDFIRTLFSVSERDYLLNTFIFFTGLNSIWLGLGRIDENDFATAQRRQDSSGLSGSENSA